MNQGKAGKILFGRSINASDVSSKQIINGRSHEDIFIWDQIFMATFFECILKADLGGKVFPYDYRAQLAYVMTFDHPHAYTFHLLHPHVSLRMP